jgi:hypothetical protein
MLAEGSLNSEIRANLLMDIGSNFCGLSECALESLPDQSDFDSAIRRFDSSRPSQFSYLIVLEFFAA